MKASFKNKILFFDDLVEKVAALRKSGKKVVQSHGIFDLIHPGIINHLTEARDQGNVLIVTVIKDKNVRRGSGRPIFPENMRAENVAALEQVDYVCLVDDDIPFECVKKIKPDIFAKGRAYKKRYRMIYQKIDEEEKEFYFGKSKIYETKGFSFSSSRIINNFLDIYSKETKHFLKLFSEKHAFKQIARYINNLKGLKTLVLGDGIVDEYHYCDAIGKSAKSPIVVNRYIAHEVFAGGAFAIANHVSGLCDQVHIVTLLGKDDSRKDFILKSLRPNVTAKFFYRDDGPTIIKKRYVSQYSNLKLFEVNYLNDNDIDGVCEANVMDYLKSILPKYDLVLVSDFGHGFITKNVIKVIEQHSKQFAVNTQTNGANSGYNMITKYKNPDFVCLDETEARYATQNRFGDIEIIAKDILKTINAGHLIVTLGKRGSIGVDKSGEINKTPIFSTKVIDTVGAGDAFFSFTAPCFAHGMPLDLVSFVGNAVGALAVQIVGNKKPVEKHALLEFIHGILR
ncbi:adenylyltransferase/cytidyltransferase family protein [Patescibacteria group bacterium]|nr:adenylyltransferase/cytidyltransferase family protein [Patescibacteria group bacterium]